ncbi:hypothetical protein B0H19DRAFT_1246570 [Mycena capillaripes]|nr:hypothetical protein B0H19DRAFT_1246570 [Mycena capillaripes]
MPSRRRRPSNFEPAFHLLISYVVSSFWPWLSASEFIKTDDASSSSGPSTVRASKFIGDGAEKGKLDNRLAVLQSTLNTNAREHPIPSRSHWLLHKDSGLVSFLNDHPNIDAARQPFNESSPISARRMMASSTISAPVPAKAARHNLPYWQVNDSASARASDRRFSAMTVGNRSSISGSDYRDLTDKKYAYSNQNVRKEYNSKDVPNIFARKAARKREDQTPNEDSESTSESSESDSDSDDDWETVPESDREGESDKPEEDELSDDSVEIVDMGPFRPPVIELLDDTPPMSPALMPRLSPPEEIIAALESLALSAACMQELHGLPFLKRNVRRGFLNYCRARGIPTELDDQIPSISVVFKLAGSELSPHEASISCYECPLCHLHLPFQTKGMLQMHLDLDHDKVDSTWDELEDKPPPPNPLGPTARFPFLPAKSEYGGPDVKYSVRFGGPKIYDLLGTLPMEPYGILGWSILDKEEEIFESDDIPDEHKVMHALWGRWIFFNRQVLIVQENQSVSMFSSNLFIAHYFNGTKKFIDEYWKMIRLAAGWDALRYWLVVSLQLDGKLEVVITDVPKMLMTTRFLTGKDVALLLKRYGTWCSDE